MNLLHIDSSPLGAASVSRQLTADIVKAWVSAHSNARVVYRDLAAAAPDHLSGEVIQVVKFGNRENLNERQRAELALTDELVDEFLAAEVVVIGAPMYNFSVPTQLKAWIDRICQAGRTFRYTETGPVGLAAGKKVIVASARGGRYAETPKEVALDHQEAYLRAVMGFVGITDIAFIRAEGLAMGPEARTLALGLAAQEVGRLIAPVTA